MWWFQLTTLCVLKITSVPFRADVNSIREFGAQSSWLRKRLCYSLPLLFLETCFPNKVGINLLWMWDIYLQTLIKHSQTSNTFKCVNLFLFYANSSGYIRRRLGDMTHMLAHIQMIHITSSKQNLRGILKPKIFN